MLKNTTIFIVDEHNAGKRIDCYLAHCLDISRSQVQKIIDAGSVHCNEKIVTKNRLELKINDHIAYKAPDICINKEARSLNHEVYNSIEIVFQHDDFIIINKPAGIASHGAHKESKEPNIADWIEYNNYFNDQRLCDTLIRQGIVHRLDKDTSGIMIIARSYRSQNIISKLFHDRLVAKEYSAIVCGIPSPEKGSINYRIMRDPICPIKMTHSRAQGRSAFTHYETIEKFTDYSLIKCTPTTGRTHQIRVHLTAIGHTLIGDSYYGKSSELIARHALHASRIAFKYGENDYDFSAPLPNDMQKLIS